jgi:hypothetical protein
MPAVLSRAKPEYGKGFTVRRKPRGRRDRDDDPLSQKPGIQPPIDADKEECIDLRGFSVCVHLRLSAANEVFRFFETRSGQLDATAPRFTGMPRAQVV